MRHILLLAAGLFFLNCSYAQQSCNDDDAMSTKGSWKKNSDANTFPDQGFPKNQWPQVNSRIDKMQKLLQAAYPEPQGIEAGWYRSISGNAEVKDGPVPYALDALFLAYFCNTYEKKIEPGGETDTWFYIWANQLNTWFGEYIKIYIIQKQRVYLLNKKIGVLNGYSLYEGNYNRTSNTGTRYSRAVIITRNGQSPYLPVTQKQFLKAFLNFNEKKFIKALEFQKNRAVKTDAQEEESKQNGLESIAKNYKADAVERRKADYLKNYKTDKQQKEEWIAETIKNHEKDMKPARDMLADSLKSDLAQPVILDFDNLLTFTEFSTEEKGGRQLVRLNPDYFDMTLPRYVPQFLIAYWSWNDRKPTNAWRAQVEKNFDFNALKEMLDK